MDADDRLRLDYDQTTQLVRTLMDVRFKLLALVPTSAGAAVGLIGSPGSAAELLGIGLLGLVATFGVLLYELRNTQIFGAMLHHARTLEGLLGLHVGSDPRGPDGVLSLRTAPHARFFGAATAGHEQALALVYGAALGGWIYLVAWGALRAADFSAARAVGGLIGVVGGIAVIFEVQRVDRDAVSDEEA